MKPIENTFEEAFIHALPPLAQRVVWDLFAIRPLPALVGAWIEQQLDETLLKAHGCPARLWPQILQAALVARLTYMLPNPHFSPAHVNYLIRLACAQMGYPLDHYTLADAIGAARKDYPVLYSWLLAQLRLLEKKEPVHATA